MGSKIKRIDRKLRQWEIVSFCFALFDIVAIVFAFLIALWLRFDCEYSSIPKVFLRCFSYSIIPHVVLTVAIFALANLYNSVWKFAGYFEFVRIAIATFGTGVINLVVTQVIYGIQNGFTGARMPISYFVFGTMFQFLFCVGIRFSYRTVQLLRKRNNSDVDYVKSVLIYGAGEAGRMLAKDIVNAYQLGEKVVAFIDDDPEKQKRLIDGIRVVGGRDDVLSIVDKYHIQKIYVALPSAPKNEIKEILNVCTEATCEVLNLPGMYQLRTGQIKVSQMKEVSIEDLLGREAIKVNDEEIGRFIEGKVVLITGAGGRWWDNRTNQEECLFYSGFESFDFGLI